MGEGLKRAFAAARETQKVTPTITFPASVKQDHRERIMAPVIATGQWRVFAPTVEGYSPSPLLIRRVPTGDVVFRLIKGDRQAAFAALPMTLPPGVRVEGFGGDMKADEAPPGPQ